MVIQSHPPFTQNMHAQMEVWNWKCCLKSHYSVIGQINELTSRPMWSDVKSSFVNCHLGKKFIAELSGRYYHLARKRSSLNCPFPSASYSCTWAKCSSMNRCHVNVSTETCSSLNLWDQSCHLARQKCSTLNSNSWDMDIWPPKHVHRWT